VRAWGLRLAAAAALLSTSAGAQSLPPSLPPGVQAIYANQHGAWQVACARVETDRQVFCNLAQGARYDGGQAPLIVGVHLRREGEYVFFHFAPGFAKNSDITFLTDKKEAGELKQVEGTTLRVLPELSKTHIKQFTAGNILVVQFVPNGGADKKIARFNLAGFTASMNDARAQLKAAQGK
jgi:invasion protein IalB